MLATALHILAPHTPLLNIPFVGAEARLQKLQCLLGLTGGAITSSPVLVVGMYGMGGVGKTTLAKKVRDEAPTHRFEGRIVFLHVGARCEPGSGLEAMRSKLLRLLSAGVPQHNSDLDADRGGLRRALSNGGPVLLILDDLWTRNQLLWLLGHDDTGDIKAAVANMASGSRLLMTSRDQSVLTMNWGGFSLFEVELMDRKDAELLLSLEAQRAPSEFTTDQLKQALTICGGLPLALRVLGRQLQDVQPGQWQVTRTLQYIIEQTEGVHGRVVLLINDARVHYVVLFGGKC